MTDKKAIVLGGTYPHIDLILKLKKRGYQVILIDYLDTPPAKEYADEHIKESTLDKEKVLELARHRQVDLVISSCIDQANVTACYVGEKLDLPVPYSYETALLISDKTQMKKLMVDHEIDTAKYYKFSFEEFDRFKSENITNLSFPLIVKPADSNGSKGVVRVENIQEIEEACKNAFSISRNGKIVVEEYIDGTEIGLDCLVFEDTFEIIITRERVKTNTSKASNTIQQIYGSYWPADISKQAEDNLRENIEKIRGALKLKNTPLIIQAIVKNGDVFILEFSARIGGGDNYDIIKQKTGFDHIEASIRSFLSERQEVRLTANDYIYFDNYIYVNPAEFGAIDGFDELKKQGIIEYGKVYKNRGAKIGGEITSSNRVGVFVAKAKTRQALMEKIKIANDRISVVDVNGNNIHRLV